MSREARRWVWDTAPVDDPRQLLILLSLADVADEWGQSAFPSVARMARDSRSNDRTVQRHLKILVQAGILEVEAKSAGPRPTTYSLPMMRGDSLSGVGPDTGDTLPGVNEARGDRGVTNGDSSPLIGIGSKPRAQDDARAVDPLLGFHFFWEAYPRRNGRRLGRAKCEERWKKLDIVARRAAVKGARIYGSECGNFAKDPDRWLRDRSWVDYQIPLEQREATSVTPEVEFDQDRPNPAYGETE